MSKETVRERISDEIVRALDVSKVKAIAFAEVGAQGSSNYVAIISDLPDKVSVAAGKFGFEAYGTRHAEDVEIEVIENAIPFLKWFRGTSPETTKEGISFSTTNGSILTRYSGTTSSSGAISWKAFCRALASGISLRLALTS